MHLDVRLLRDFYYRNPLGRAAQNAIRFGMQSFWPEAKGQSVAGFGFAVPLLRPYLAEARRVIALMPAPQGVIAWPKGEDNHSVLAEEARWPIETGRIDKLVMMHGLETSERPGELLSEAERVLGPGGRALFIVPNRAGLWSRSDRTPFGFGRPYSFGQLEAQLKQFGFVCCDYRGALYQPPSLKRFWLKSGPWCERLGRRTGAVLTGGVLMVEVAKQQPAKPRGTPAKATNPLGVLDPVPKPAAARTAHQRRKAS